MDALEKRVIVILFFDYEIFIIQSWVFFDIHILELQCGSTLSP
jgi:hypothetical protein